MYNGWRKHSDEYTKEQLDSIWTIGHPQISPFLRFTPVDKLSSSGNIVQADSILVNDQANYGCCTGEAAIGMLQCFDLIINGKYTPLSVLYNYYFSRLILDGKVSGDEGSTILAAMQALVKYGNAPDIDWDFTKGLNVKPTTQAQTDAKNFGVLKYFSIPENNTEKDPLKNTEILNIKQMISSSLPVMYGSNVHQSIENVDSIGKEPYAPENSKTDPKVGAHARWIRGFDDTIVIPNAPIKGAFKVRNSWGNPWGLKGESWVSYQVFIDQETDSMGITSSNYPSVVPIPPSDPCVAYTKAIADVKAIVDKF